MAAVLEENSWNRLEISFELLVCCANAVCVEKLASAERWGALSHEIDRRCSSVADVCKRDECSAPYLCQ